MMVQAIMASGTIPAAFTPVELDDNHQVLVDGGVFSNLEMDEAILKCREKGFEDKDIIIDAIACFNSVVELDPWTLRESKFESAYGYYQRKRDLSSFYYYYEEIIRVVR
jgi:predicted acylesterase/phospholipase RssA